MGTQIVNLVIIYYVVHGVDVEDAQKWLYADGWTSLCGLGISSYDIAVVMETRYRIHSGSDVLSEVYRYGRIFLKG